MLKYIHFVYTYTKNVLNVQIVWQKVINLFKKKKNAEQSGIYNSNKQKAMWFVFINKPNKMKKKNFQFRKLDFLSTVNDLVIWYMNINYNIRSISIVPIPCIVKWLLKSLDLIEWFVFILYRYTHFYRVFWLGLCVDTVVK